MLTTIGGAPRMADAALVPKYPGPLPGGVRPELSVSLTGLTKESQVHPRQAGGAVL
ncbi:hypothetical protein HCK01_36730, partial [Streptomyces sp. AA8]|uniref:ferritin-like domain-containing protein n=1 Tax=Streptomyces telluris TaxID=2720021 RepID=UPI0016A633C7